MNNKVDRRISSGSTIIRRSEFELDRLFKFPQDIEYYPTLVAQYLEQKDAYSSYHETSNLDDFLAIIRSDPSLIEKMQKVIDDSIEFLTLADKLRIEFRSEYSRELATWEENTASLRGELDELRKGLVLIKAEEHKQKFGLGSSPQALLDVSIPFLIQTNVTRFGPMFIILFFVAILVNLYRYAIRLSAYYDARADALVFIGLKVSPEAFERHVFALSPDSHDIGKPPKLPTEHVVDIAKSAISKASSSTDRSTSTTGG